MDRQEAVRRAAQACGVRSVATHIAERDGQHLIFVSLPVEAYYLVVHFTGRVRDVGGENEGITTSWVIQYFDVAQNPMQFRTDIAAVCTEAVSHGTKNRTVGSRT